MTNAKAGDVVTFGRYPQTSTADIMPIQWLVLDRDGDYLLMISYYCLDVVRYHNTNQAVTWETCDLRKWLNNDFYNFAFTSEEKAFIARARLINEDSANASGGSSTYDNVFLLSANEAASLFSSDEARSAQPTGFAKALGAYTSKAGNVWWWLRTPGRAPNYAAGVYGRGEIDTDGEIVDLSKYDKIVDAVRPVIFVNIAP